MKSLKTIIESQVLLEAFSNKYLREADNYLHKEFKSSLKEIGKKLDWWQFKNYAWDKVDSSNVHTYDAEQSIELKRSYRNGGKLVFFYDKNDQLVGISIGSYLIVLQTKADYEKRVAEQPEYDRERWKNAYPYAPIANIGGGDLSKWGKSSSVSKEFELVDWAQDHADYFVIIDASEYINNQLHQERIASQNGIVLKTAEYFEKVAKSNQDRYQKILTSRRATNNKEYEEIDDLVDEHINEVTKIVRAIRKNPSLVKSRYEVQKLLNFLQEEKHSNYGRDGLLKVYKYFCDDVSDLMAGSHYGSSDAKEYFDRQRENIQKRMDLIRKICTDIDKYIDSLGIKA